ncbi:tRNA pseudouridine(55) synthase TruB [Marinobacterium mangrovicola]|uniref:tRNA pseudouridine synthase B n=1 Tax=Marinobacterium mangrovicola TaxID=1476959 RepID=A0A4R1GDR8_9GAMM|nr:tRNA pseudouridine(55) synthase TruB [Marinobacterium mangrovicola]TCK04971.1 tRNA pseudouridine synthase B [Marinobacterium mangrovicola]
MARKPKGRRIDGVFLLDKPGGLSSNAVLQRVKRIYGAAKAGHTGALDPLATGMLPICLGEATKFSQYLLESDKRYRTTAKLGVRTDSSDADGAVIETKPVPDNLSREQIEALLVEHFSGEIEQVPSMYSALKHNGQPLYKLARQGIQVEVKPRRVTIHEIKLLDLREDELDLEVYCSKGTYIRSIVEDLGLMLGCGAHVSVLRRLDTGPYQEPMMMPLEQLQALAEMREGDDTECIQGRLDQLLLPPWTAIASLPALELCESQAKRLQCGQGCADYFEQRGEVRLFITGTERFIGVGEVADNGILKPKRLMSTAPDTE